MTGSVEKDSMDSEMDMELSGSRGYEMESSRRGHPRVKRGVWG